MLLPKRVVHLSATIIKGMSIKEETTYTDLTVLPVTLTQQERSLPSYAMLDTRADRKRFINQEWAQDNHLELLPLQKPIYLESFDRRESESRPITHYVRINLM